MKINVTGSGVTAALPEDMVDELITRLERFGAPDAGRRLRSQRSILREDVSVVREVLASGCARAASETTPRSWRTFAASSVGFRA
jgi:hypothetical protein